MITGQRLMAAGLVLSGVGLGAGLVGIGVWIGSAVSSDPPDETVDVAPTIPPDNQLCSTPFECAQEAVARVGVLQARIVSLETHLTNLQARLVARDAQLADIVLAFDRRDCPAGWQRFEAGANRFLLVAPDAETYSTTGGNAEVTITVEQMPAHSHAHGRTWSHTLGPWLQRGDGTHPSDVTRRTEETGGGQPVEIVPPYIALTFCRQAVVNSSDNTDE